MTRLFLVLAIVLSMSACATVEKTSQPIGAKPATGTIKGFATLASFGTFEMELAPLYTRLAVLRHNAAKHLRNGEISVDTAIEIQRRADLMRADLDKAKQLDLDKKTDDALYELAIVNIGLSTAERLIP